MKLTHILIALLALWASPAAGAASKTRPIVEAMPPATMEALFLESLERMEPAMNGLSAALGSGFALAFAEVAPLPNLVLQGQVRGDHGALGLDPAGGIGIFRVEGYAGVVGVVAVSDETRAMRALALKLSFDGAELLDDSRAGMELKRPMQPPVMAFVHRGYLYLAMPDEGPGRQANRDLAALVRAAPPGGLGGTELWKRVSSRVDRRGAVVFFRRQPLEQVPDVLGLALAVRPEPDRLQVNGFAATARPLAPGVPLEPRDLLRHAPGSPALVLSSHLGPQVARALLLSGVMSSSWLGLGGSAGSLASGVGGGLDALGYTRASVVPGEGQAWGSESAVLWEASLEDAAAAEAALRHRSRRRLQGSDATAWRIRIRTDVLSAAAGPPPSGPPRDVLAELAERFGGGAFGSGHLSLYVDLPMIHESYLDAAEPVPALLPRGDHLFLDAAAAAGGLTIRGELSLIQEESAVGRR